MITVGGIIEKVKQDYEIVLNTFEIIDEKDVPLYAEEYIFELDNGLFLYSEDYYDLEYDK